MSPWSPSASEGMSASTSSMDPFDFLLRRRRRRRRRLVSAAASLPLAPPAAF